MNRDDANHVSDGAGTELAPNDIPTSAFAEHITHGGNDVDDAPPHMGLLLRKRWLALPRRRRVRRLLRQRRCRRAGQ